MELLEKVDGKHLASFNWLIVGMEVGDDTVKLDVEVFKCFVWGTFEEVEFTDNAGNINKVFFHWPVSVM